MFNVIEDVKEALMIGHLARLPCQEHILKAVVSMEEKLKQYYGWSGLPHVYVDAMLLSPRTKLSIFNTTTSWSDENPDEYKQQSRDRFLAEYDGRRAQSNNNVNNAENERPTKRAKTSNTTFDEFQSALIQKTNQNRKNDFDRYIDIPNDPHLKSSLGCQWWREHASDYPNLASMARKVLATPASGCAVERVFSVSGRIATWQRNRLSGPTVKNLMIYRDHLKNQGHPLQTDGETSYKINMPVLEEGGIPEGWDDSWWKDKLTINEQQSNVLPLMDEDDNDIY